MSPREAARVVSSLRTAATARDTRDRRKAVRLTDREIEALDILIKMTEVPR